MKTKRQLAAILFADIVGYTALMQKDEQAASNLLRHFQQQLEEKVTAYNGRIVNFYGDGALCTFQIPIDAVRCAMALQTTFNNSPKTPVRIGIHSGTVTLEGDKIFGDSVNITSRIESMGISGGILLSKKVRDEVKNNPDLAMIALGSFEFKNVEEPMEVFALANDGFVIPKRSEITGKLKPKKKKWLIPLVILALLSVVSFFWKSNSSGGMELLPNNPTEPEKTPLSEKYRQKQVAVMVFENKTGSENLENFGTMISDWVTKGLMETGEANVISAANIQHQIAETGLGQGPNPEFARNTGVDVMLQGRYYLQENRLIIHANIVEIKSGEVIHALTPIAGDKAKMLGLLDELTQEVLSYWAVKNAKRFLQNPPKYEAWEKFKEGDRLYLSDFQKAERLFKESFQLDTTFFAPILKLAILYTGYNKPASDSLKAFILTKLPYLTKWERLRWDVSKAASEGDFLTAAQLTEKLYLMDKSDANANYNIGIFYWAANYPKKALSILNDLDPRFRKRDKEVSKMEWLIAGIYNEIGAYQKAIDVLQTYSYPKLYIGNATAYLTALIGLKKYDLLDTQLSDYLKQKDFQSNEESISRLYRATCNQLWARNEEANLKKYAIQFKRWLQSENNTVESLENQIYIEIYLGNYNQAITLLKQVNSSTIASGFSNELPMLMGFCYAKKGDAINAEKQIEKVLIHDYVSRYRGLQYYNKARIETAMNQKDAAIKSLKKAIEQGIPFAFERFKNDGFFNPLFGYPPFEELVKQKG